MPLRSRTKKLVLVFFLVCAAVLSFYTFRLVQSGFNYMVEVKTSNEYLRKVAWWILAYADEKGTFPRSDEDLLTFQPGHELTHSLFHDEKREVRKYPLSTIEARARSAHNSDIAYLLQMVEIHYADQPDIAPVLSVNQKHAERDLERVNNWLKQAQTQLNAH
ncbi:hypothetical protein [Gimesia sp.]|uniref:hypothetical protein n=1 Tax=Gimesia sp. TaxID=2024833 RepID=UPI003A90E2AD